MLNVLVGLLSVKLRGPDAFACAAGLPLKPEVAAFACAGLPLKPEVAAFALGLLSQQAPVVWVTGAEGPDVYPRKG